MDAALVVADNVPDGAVVVGNPARVIRRVDELVCEAGFYDRPYDWPPYVP